MKINPRILGLAAVIVAGGGKFTNDAVAAEDAGWKFSIGYVYRSFGDIDLKSFDFEENASGYVDGAEGVDTDTPTDGLPNSINWPGLSETPTPPVPMLHEDVSFGGGEKDLDETGGFELRGMVQPEGSMVGWDISVVALDQSMSTSTDSLAASRETWTNVAGNFIRDITPNPTRNVGFVDYDIEFTLITYGLGVTKEYSCRDWYVRGGVGPTLNLVDHDTIRREGIDYTAFRSVVNAEHDGEMEFKLGAYARVGAGYTVRENTSIEIGARYDYIDEVDGEFIDLDLSGLSGNVSLVFKF